MNLTLMSNFTEPKGNFQIQPPVDMRLTEQIQFYGGLVVAPIGLILNILSFIVFCIK